MENNLFRFLYVSCRNKSLFHSGVGVGVRCSVLLDVVLMKVGWTVGVLLKVSVGCVTGRRGMFYQAFGKPVKPTCASKRSYNSVSKHIA